MAEITLADLLAWEPRLRPARGVAGPAWGAVTEADVDREITWAVSARATAPMLPQLRGGELVLLAHRILAESGVAIGPLLRELASHRAAAVVLEAEAVPPGLRAAGAPLPLLVLPVGPMTPDLEGDLNRLLTQKRGELYRAGTEIGRVLAGLTAAGADLARILAATAEELDVPVEVVDGRGLPLASAGTGNEGWTGGGDGQAPAGRREGPLVVPLADGESLRLGPVLPDRRALARLVGERVAVAAEAALVRSAQTRPRGPARASALGDFLTLVGPQASDLGARATALGLANDGTYRVALAADGPGAATLQRWATRYGPVHDAGRIDGALAAVVEVRGDAADSGPIGAGWPRSGASPTGKGITAARESPGAGWVALSGPAGGARLLPAAAREARYVAALLSAGLLPGPLARFDALAEIGAFRLLYEAWGSQALASFAAGALGRLPERDRRQSLHRTLLAYLETGGSHVEAAARLGIHRNTLAYRLKQIAALTGHDPADPSKRLLLHLGLLAASLPPVPA